MIKFVTDGTDLSNPVFEDVEEDQFFIDSGGDFCQKSSDDSYNTIADSDGSPSGYTVNNVNSDQPVFRILPRVMKIELGDNE